MEKISKLFHPFSITQFILANLAMGVLIMLIFMHGATATLHNFLLGTFWAFTICITQWGGLVFVNHLIDRKIKWIEQPILRSVLGIVSLVGYSVFIFASVQFIMLYLLYGTVPADAWPMVSKSSILTLLISFFMSLTFTAAGFFKAWKLALVNSEKLKTEMMAYKYESLRNQINPHFLFNSFNVLSDLVYADQAMAVKFINQLSELFRYVLDSRDKELVPLQDELDFMHAYIYLLKTRFEDKLDLKIGFEAAADELIVPMTLQLLVENAVKHNEVSEAFPLCIRITRNETCLEVENTLRLKRVGENSKNTGLKNIRQQFSFFTDRQIEVSDTNGKFMVRIPILKVLEK
ncbi:MAG: sensor histidine kinase [Bacteroidota bacterium]